MLKTIISTVFAFLFLVQICPGEIVVDNDQGPPAFTTEGSWTLSGYTGYDGGTYLFTNSSNEESTATWTPDVSVGGLYQTYMAFRPGENRTKNAPVTIHHSGGSEIVNVNMYGTGEVKSVYLGNYYFEAGTTGRILLSNNGGAGYYIADAIILKEPGEDPPQISEIRLDPIIPGSHEPVHITCRITDDLDEVSTAAVFYETGASSLSGSVPALDDGLHGDGSSNDDIYGAKIPGMDSGEFVTWFIEARDMKGMSSRSETSSYFVSDAVTSPLVFILAGQSNASGRGALDENNTQPHPFVIMFGNDYAWKQAYEPVDDPTGQVDSVSDDSLVITSTRGHGFSLQAARDVIQDTTQTIRLIPCPLGGTRISQWRRGADPFDRSTLFGSCNYRRSVAAPEGLTALWWYQGESDAGSSTFVGDNSALMNEFREEMGSDLSIVYVQLGRGNGENYNRVLQVVAEGQRRMETGSGDAASLSGHYMVPAFDLPLNDNIHLTQGAQQELGRRVALTTRHRVLGEDIDGNGPRLLTVNPISHPKGDKSTIHIKFNRGINQSINQYDNQFIVREGTRILGISEVQREPEITSTLTIILSETPSGNVTVSYGEAASDVRRRLENVIKASNGIPAPRFGPLPVIEESVSATGFFLR